MTTMDSREIKFRAWDKVNKKMYTPNKPLLTITDNAQSNNQ